MDFGITQNSVSNLAILKSHFSILKIVLNLFYYPGIIIHLADRAKAIKTKAVVNESPTDKLIRELREENARLLERLKLAGGDPVALAAIAAEQSGIAPEENGNKIDEAGKIISIFKSLTPGRRV